MLIFGIMLTSFLMPDKQNKITVKTVDMIYKGIENFIFICIAGVFLF